MLSRCHRSQDISFLTLGFRVHSSVLASGCPRGIRIPRALGRPVSAPQPTCHGAPGGPVRVTAVGRVWYVPCAFWMCFYSTGCLFGGLWAVTHQHPAWELRCGHRVTVRQGLREGRLSTVASTVSQSQEQIPGLRSLLGPLSVVLVSKIKNSSLSRRHLYRCNLTK